MNIDLGDLPTWITALVAVGGVVFGGYNLRKLRLDRQRQQADRIYFGYEFIDDNDFVNVMNLSDAPITNLLLYFCDYPERAWKTTASRPLLLMSDQWKMELRYPDEMQLIVGYLEFDDASGRTWCRLSNQKLYASKRYPGILARIRFFPGPLIIALRTWRMSSDEKNNWLRRNGFVGGLLRWGFGPTGYSR